MFGSKRNVSRLRTIVFDPKMGPSQKWHPLFPPFSCFYNPNACFGLQKIDSCVIKISLLVGEPFFAARLHVGKKQTCSSAYIFYVPGFYFGLERRGGGKTETFLFTPGGSLLPVGRKEKGVGWLKREPPAIIHP